MSLADYLGVPVKRWRPPSRAPRNAPMTRQPRLDGEGRKPIIGEGYPRYPIYRNPNPRRKRYS